MTPRKILIVDDIPMNVKLLRAQLEGEGNIVVSASNGVEALAILNREPVDVIISDILMPDMDGYRLCYEVRSSDQFEQLPFIFHTATYTSPADEKLSMEMGADKYLCKPYSIADLMRAIEEAQRMPRRRPPLSPDAADVLKEYSERMISKLEEKNIELNEAFKALSLRTMALDTAADAILITDDKGTILWINHAFTTMTGFSKEEAIGQTPRILKSGKHDAAFYKDFWDTIRSGKVWRGEFTNVRKDGTLCYDEHTVSPAFGPNGEITNFVGVLHEVTRRKLAEEELRLTNERLSNLIEHSPAVLYAHKVEGDAIVPQFATGNVTRLLGFPLAETMSYEWWLSRLHPDDRERAIASVKETSVAGGARVEYRLQHKDGSYRWVDDSRRLVRDDQGLPREIVGVWTDVTERRRAQDELRISEQRVSSMLQNIELVSRMLDCEGRITYCNEYLLKLTGWERDELIGGDWFDLFATHEAGPGLKLRFSSLLSEAQDYWNHESELVTRSGARRVIHWHNTIMRSGSGTIIGTASIGEDITERKEIEKQLFRAQRLESLGTLAGGIAHDLNNLFMPILLGASMIKRFEPGAASQKAVQTIERCVRRGTELVKQVLLLARVGDGERIAVNVRNVVAEVHAITHDTFPKNVAFNTSIANSVPAILVDPTQLSQVLLNLCINARDAMPAGGEIEVSVNSADIEAQYAVAHGGSAAGRYVVIEVTDTGTGMEQKVIDRIYEPFFTTKDAGKGTGLGLSTALGIVRSNGGFMTAASEPGQGTSFKVYFPALLDTPSILLPAAAREGVVPGGAGEAILLVNDERLILEITSQTLESLGYEVLTAADGAQAIDVFVRHRARIALVITDMMMPSIDGGTLIGALRRIDPVVRVVAMSGVGGPQEANRAKKAGTPYFLAKPFTVELLLQTVSDALHAVAN